ncbi:MAG: glutaminyl-peptide cyclotransferase [Actinomycetota bacterium]|nr:glutaminyl-peptide cyclotransferase [Actinomycetota bacterium]
MTARAPSTRLGAGCLLVAIGVVACGADVTEELPQTSLDIVAVHPRADGFTQGLELLDDGRLLHSTGLRGDSEIRVEDLDGSVIERRPLPDDHFGEGATVVGDTAYQLTWQSGVVHTWSVPALEPGPTYRVDGEGWGLCHDEFSDLLWLSDGSSRLHKLGLPDLQPGATVEVTRDGQPVSLINELECVDGHVWANVWCSDDVIEIDPDSGRVVSAHDLSELAEVVQPDDAGDVLNGIAYDASDGTWLVTGKRWDRTFRLRLDGDTG